MAQAVHQDARRIEGAVLQVVLRRRAQCVVQLPRPSPVHAAGQGRDHLRGRRRQGDEDHLPRASPRSVQVRERAEVEGRQARRPRADLHADVDPRGRGDAGVRAHRRDALGGVRRVLGEEHPGARRRRGRHCDRHRRRAVPRRTRDPAQARGRRSARDGRLRRHPQRHRLQAHGLRRADEGGPRRVVGRRRQRPARDLRAHVGQRRASAVHPLHLGIDRQAEGRAALDRGLPAACDPHDEVDVRLQADRRLLVHGGRRLGHGAHLHRVRAARVRRDADRVRRRADASRCRPLLEDDPGPQGHRVLHGADRDPLAHQGRRRPAEEVRPVEAAHPRHRRRAHQSRSMDVVLRDGRSGRTVRSSTRGGKPRRAAT